MAFSAHLNSFLAKKWHLAASAPSELVFNHHWYAIPLYAQNSLETVFFVWDDLQKQKTNFIIFGSMASGSNISPNPGHKSFRICQIFTFDHLSFCFFETFTRITPDLEKHQTEGFWES